MFLSYHYFTLNFVFIQPNREDEYARIEASGGKVIQWNGHRVFGVLAMSRSIGKLSIIAIVGISIIVVDYAKSFKLIILLMSLCREESLEKYV